MTDLGLVVRPMTSGDLPYVARTWLMCVTERDAEGRRRRGYQRRKAYDAEMPRVAAVISRSLVWCACCPSSPATIHGFLVVSHSRHVEFLFVPKVLRHNGIEDLLLTFATASEEPCKEHESNESSSKRHSRPPAAA